MTDFLILFLFGYLIGSISPGYFFGRIIKGIDIRKHNRRNTGATNTYLTVGPVYGVITGAIDFLKASFVYYIAVSGFSGFGLSAVGGKFLNFETLSSDLAILVGLAAVTGHIFPFYLGFRGGRGVASLYGLAFTNLFFSQSVFALILFVGTVFYAIAVSQRPEVKEFLSKAPLRKFLKLAGLVLPLGYLAYSDFFANFVLVLFITSFGFDVMRFLVPELNQRYLRLKKLAKEKELKRFSGYTLFLFSAFMLFWFFPKDIAVLCLLFFIVGDVFTPLGPVFLAKETMPGKTWGGAFLIFTLTFITGLFLNSLTPVSFSFKVLALAAFLTAFLDQFSVSSSKPFSFLVDDNFLVPLGTAILLTLLV